LSALCVTSQCSVIWFLTSARFEGTWSTGTSGCRDGQLWLCAVEQFVAEKVRSIQKTISCFCKFWWHAASSCRDLQLHCLAHIGVHLVSQRVFVKTIDCSMAACNPRMEQNGFKKIRLPGGFTSYGCGSVHTICQIAGTHSGPEASRKERMWAALCFLESTHVIMQETRCMEPPPAPLSHAMHFFFKFVLSHLHCTLFLVNETK